METKFVQKPDMFRYISGFVCLERRHQRLSVYKIIKKMATNVIYV